MRNQFSRVVGLLAAALVAAGLACAGNRSRPDKDASTVSKVEPRHGEYEPRAEPIPHRPPVASRGGCEPRYKNGLTGTCIDGKPCRGFGVLENDRAVCVCYAKRGGCDEGQRCDPQQARCVKEEELPFGRAQ